MHLNSELLFLEYAKIFFRSSFKILEIGPTGFPSHYHRLIDNNKIDWHYLDIGSQYIGTNKTDDKYINTPDPYNYPLQDNSYDVVLAGQVLEHVPKLSNWLIEIKRITKPRGSIILISPVSWPYHEAPVDCWRVYPDGMKALAVELGLEVIICIYKSLEKEIFFKNTLTIPGTSSISIDRKVSRTVKTQVAFNRLYRSIPVLRRLRIPIQVAYDLITVLQKK